MPMGLKLDAARPTNAVTSGRRAAPGSRLRATWLDAVVLLVILACGILHVHTAVGGDQYLYLVGAEKIAHHGVIYRDFWDLKQPGIYYLYGLGGLLFGFTPAGLHVFEALYQTAFSAVLIAVCSVRFRYRAVASIVPLLTVGVYYGTATNYVLGSVEAFAGFPLFVAAVCAADAFGAKRGKLLLGVVGGVAGALVVMFKLVYLPLVVAVWLAALMLTWRTTAPLRRLSVLLALVAGLVVPLGLFGAYLAVAGALGLAVQTSFVDPALIVRHLHPGSKTPLRYFTKTFILALWPIIVLALGGLATLRRRSDVLAIQMAVWLIVAVPLIVVQTWTFYLKFFVVIVPVGVLAAYGVGFAWALVVERRGGARPLAAGIAVVLAGIFALTVVRTQRENAAWAAADARDLRRTIAFLGAPAARPGAIYVMGDPKVYYFTRRDQAIPINGWSPELLLPEQWHTVHAQLAAAAPAYIVVENGGDVPIDGLVRQNPEMSDFLATQYRADLALSEATVYEHR